MTRSSRVRAAGLLLRHLRSGARTSVLVALLVTVTVTAVSLAPRMLSQLGDRELRHSLATSTPTNLDLAGSGKIGLVEGTADDAVSTTDQSIEGLQFRWPEPLRSTLGEPRWLIRSASNIALSPRFDDSVELRLSIDPDWRSRTRLVGGRRPASWPGNLAAAEETPIEVAVSQALAERLRLRVGDRLDYSPADLVVTGIVTVADADGSYAVHTSDLVSPAVRREPGVVPTVLGSVYVAPGSADGLATLLLSGTITAWLPVDPAGVDFADAEALQTLSRQVGTTPIELPYGGQLVLRTGLADVIEAAAGRITATYALFALTLSGLAGVLVALFALGVQSLVRRRQPALALLVARGAGPAQVRGLMVLEGLLVAVPGSALGITLAAWAVPAEVGPVGRAMPLLTAALVPVLCALLTPVQGQRELRRDLQVRARSQARWVVEVGVAGLTVVSLLVLVRRGLVESSQAVGVDPLLVAAPLLLANTVCFAVLRLYPFPLLGFQRQARRRAGAVALLGSARAVRDPALGFAAASALVVGLAGVVFSAVMATTIQAAVVAEAHDRVGADVRASATGHRGLDDTGVDRVRELPGVRSVAAYSIGPEVELDPGRTAPVTLVVADTTSLHATRPDLPVLDGTEALLGTERGDGSGPAALRGHQLGVTAVVDPATLPGLGTSWVLVDRSAVPARLRVPAPRQLLVRLDDEVTSASMVAPIEAALPTGTVELEDVDGEVASIRASPAVGYLEPVLLAAALTALVLTVLAVVLASMSASRSRRELLGVLRILGMSRRQLRAVVAWELAPVAGMAVVVGTGLGLLLPWVVTTALDLRPFVGGRVPPEPVLAAGPLAAAIGAFVAVVAVVGLVSVVVGSRITPAHSVKMGET